MPRKLPEINSAPQADIAFMLLIFFLVTTTMNVDKGISRILPPFDNTETRIEIRERNTFIVLINKYDQLWVEGKRTSIKLLKDKTKEFFLNSNHSETLPEIKVLKDVPYFGDIRSTPNAIISLQNDRETSYEMYIKVQNELTAAVRELQNDLSLKRFRKKYDDLPSDQQQAIKRIHPMAISEAEPMNIGG